VSLLSTYLDSTLANIFHTTTLLTTTIFPMQHLILTSYTKSAAGFGGGSTALMSIETLMLDA